VDPGGRAARQVAPGIYIDDLFFTDRGFAQMYYSLRYGDSGSASRWNLGLGEAAFEGNMSRVFNVSVQSVEFGAAGIQASMGPVEPHGPTGTGGYLGNETGPGSYGEAFEMDEVTVRMGSDGGQRSAYDLVAGAIGMAGLAASSAQGTSLNSSFLGSNGELYRINEATGRVFRGNKYVRVSSVGRMLSRVAAGAFAGGVVFSVYGAYSGYSSLGKAGVDVFFGAISFTGVGLAVAVPYFIADTTTGGEFGESIAWGIGLGRPYPGSGRILCP
jgi:hypothetical protein